MSMIEISPSKMEDIMINQNDEPDETITIYVKDEKKQTKGGRDKTIMQESIHDQQAWENTNENIPTNMERDEIYHMHKPNEPEACGTVEMNDKVNQSNSEQIERMISEEGGGDQQACNANTGNKSIGKHQISKDSYPDENDEESKFGVNKKEGAGDNYGCDANDGNMQVTMEKSEITYNNDSSGPAVNITNVQIDMNLQKSDNMIMPDNIDDQQARVVNMCKIAENKEDSSSDSGDEGGIWFTAPVTYIEEYHLPTYFDEERPTYYGWDESMWSYVERKEKFSSYFGDKSDIWIAEPALHAEGHSNPPTYREPANQYARKIKLFPTPEITEDPWPSESERISDDTAKNTIQGKSSKKRRLLSFFRCFSRTSRKQKKVHHEKSISGDSKRAIDESRKNVSEDTASPGCSILSWFFSSRK
ncbi:uncharacterized protein LOC100933903 [Sarcophilus harrisii]|uniref:uncharacterized protein LOC100933903 n=1 Tax=Sarcophilus harrisii TaxID=9305 RepID=UPI001301FFED|nr:uncharacterized protein LOC100933903 [Sarcophilus harrisii]